MTIWCLYRLVFLTGWIHWLKKKTCLHQIFFLTTAQQTWHSVKRSRRDRRSFLFLALPTVSVRRKRPDEWGGKLKDEEQGQDDKEEKTGGRKSIMWTKHAIHLGHLPLCACVCVCKGLYKGAEQPTPMYKYPQCCWWSREKGQSESAHPYHSSSSSLFPSINPSSLFFFLSILLLLQLYIYRFSCFFHEKTTKDFTWQANGDLQLAMIVRKVTTSYKQNRLLHFHKSALLKNGVSLMPRFPKERSCWIIV